MSSRKYSAKKPLRSQAKTVKLSHSGSAPDRLIAWVFVATIFHVFLLFGISFVQLPKNTPSNSLDVTLAIQDDKVDNPDADFIAQSNQLGSGTELDVLAPKTNKEADSAANTAENNSNQALLLPDAQKAHEFFVSVISSDWKIEQPKDNDLDIEDKIGEDQDLSLPQQAESLRAQLRQSVQELAAQPKKRILTAASTKSSDEAEYLNNWLSMVENVGNLNYPYEIKRRRLEGVVRVLVSINPDGSLNGIEIRESSGSSLIDESAKRIVRLAEPFPPFSNSMNEFDVVEIIRSWKFEIDLSLDK
jgi:periplasmic protein TonB